MPSLKSYPSTVYLKVFHEVGQSFCSSSLHISQMQKNPPSFSIIISPTYDSLLYWVFSSISHVFTHQMQSASWYKWKTHWNPWICAHMY